MAHVSNLDPSRRPLTPSKDRGPIQRRARRAFIGSGKQVLSTPEIRRWAYPRQTKSRRSYLHEVLRRYCEKVGRSAGVGRPWLWKLREEK
jgi:hypothetical protein